MLQTLRHLWGLRSRISTQMYIALAITGSLTIAASFVGWFSFNRIGSAQDRVVNESVPELAAAFRIAEYGGILSAAAPRLVASTTPSELQVVSDEIAAAQSGFEDQLIVLQQYTGDEQFENVRVNSQTVLFRLLSNINAIEGTMPQRFTFQEATEALRLELIDLRTRIEDLLIPAIDDQLFYQLTGYRTLGEPPVEREQHLSEVEFDRYRHLATIRADTTLATQLLASAFTVSQAALIEPLQEDFESAAGRLHISIASLGEAPVTSGLEPIITRLIEMGTSEEDGFSLLLHNRQLEDRQHDLLTENQNLALALVGGVNEMVTHAERNASDANVASFQALQTGRTLLLVISLVGVLGAVLTGWGFVGRVLIRRIGQLSDRMRRMADGDLEGAVEIQGKDEVAEMATALEVFRRHALEVQRLNLVEKLATELTDKNEQLEEVLADLQRAQDQIVLREKLVALGEVTAGVAHEIRNPLNFIKNFGEASMELIEELHEIYEEADGDPSAEDQELIDEILQDVTDNLNRIHNHSERANRIVHDMLMMGRGGGEWHTVKLNELLNEHALLAFHSARATDPEFQLELQRDLDPNMGQIEAIPQDLGRTFLNLVGNACHATHKKRMELVNSEGDQQGDPYYPVVLLKTRRGDSNAVVTIRDNGTGVPQEIIDKIFNPFFTTKPTNEGTGLGLALSNDIVRQHGGAITVRSEEGEFTEMIIELPLTKPDLTAAEEAAIDHTDGR